ncbi:c-type cytochrome biogenesis protein CcsB, partial [Streptomyces sp. NPDC006385]
MNPTTTADQTLAQLSNWLIYSAIAVYLLAFLTHCAEWAFGSRSRIARLAATPATHQAGGAGTAAETAAKGRTQSRTASAVSTAVLARSTARLTAEDASGPGDGPAAADSAPQDPRSDLLGRIGVSLTALAFLLHLASVATRAWSV